MASDFRIVELSDDDMRAVDLLLDSAQRSCSQHSQGDATLAVPRKAQRRLPVSIAARAAAVAAAAAAASGSKQQHTAGSAAGCQSIPCATTCQHQQQQQCVGRSGLPLMQFMGSTRYVSTAAEVECVCAQLLSNGMPQLLGLDIEWRCGVGSARMCVG
jgi:hypothetical protein